MQLLKFAGLFLMMGLVVACGQSKDAGSNFGEGLGLIPKGGLLGNKRARPSSGGGVSLAPTQPRPNLIAGPKDIALIGPAASDHPDMGTSKGPPERPEKIRKPGPVATVIVPAATPPKVGMRIYVVERVRCAPPSQARILLFSGLVAASGDFGDPIRLRVGQRFFMQFDAVKEGTNGEDSFCIPSGRYCWEKADMHSFGGSEFKIGSEASFDTYSAGPSEAELTSMIDRAVSEQCG